MNFKTLEAWLVELMPKDHQHWMKLFIQCIQENPALQFTIGMSQVYPDLVSDNREVRAAALNGLMMGICFAEAYRVAPEFMERNIQGFLDFKQKGRGENVLNFLTERAKR